MTRSTSNVWATEARIGKHIVRQLLVREHRDLEVCDSPGGGEHICSPYGQWPALRGREPDADGPLTAVLPVLGDGSGPLKWRGSRQRIAPDDVLSSFDGAIGFTAPGQPKSLRRPQIAALHSIVGYQASGLTDPGVVIMPTGTGKTETMLAWLVAERPTKLLVIVPSGALRDQIASKFETLGILQERGIVAAAAVLPCVTRLERRLETADEARDLVAASNVVIATPNVLQASDGVVREAFFPAFTHLLVDEAHHAPAPTWNNIIRSFADRPVLLFTATPFRRDGRILPGRVIFRFPLREAQREGYFSSIDFSAVLDLDDDDSTLAEAALARLRADLGAGKQHILLARAATKARADEIHALYCRLASDLAPTVLYESIATSKRKEALQAIRTGASRIIVCVDMLGEGFDLPTLKVGAFHDAHKSLSPMIQLIGRLARTSAPEPIGTASVFVRQDPKQALSPLRFLLREDPDWDKVLSDVTEHATQHADEVSVFDASFVDTPSDVPVGLLEPKMSAIAYRTSADGWDPLNGHRVYPGTILDGLISISDDNDVAWFVIETTDDLRWGNIPSLRQTNYTLVAMHLDQSRRLLFVHGSDTKRNYDDLAEAVLGQEAERVNGYAAFKVFGGLDRLVPTNIGLLDVRDRDKRFSMHVGSDVETALTEAERTHKANTHVAARAFENGERVSIAASLSGRFWSPRTASSLAEWRKWSRDQGKKLTDRAIDVHSLFRDMIIPIDVKERPPHIVLALEWPWELYTGNGTALHLGRPEGDRFILTDATFTVDTYADTGSVPFSVHTPTWNASYEATFGATGVHYRPVGTEFAEVINSRGSATSLSAWLNNNKPTLLLAGDRMITGDDRLLAPRAEIPPYPRQSLRSIDWAANGINIRVESQGPERRADSIQAHMVKHLTNTQPFDVLIDDDRSGEAADIVGIRVDHGDLIVTLVHCKYSSEDTPGGRVADLYEVCGQAMRGARWRDDGSLPLLEHLDRRAQRYAQRTGGSAFELGDRKTLFKIRQQAPQLFPRLNTVVVQPGVSTAAVTNEQLRLLAGAANYVQAVTKGRFDVYVSD